MRESKRGRTLTVRRIVAMEINKCSYRRVVIIWQEVASYDDFNGIE